MTFISEEQENVVRMHLKTVMRSHSGHMDRSQSMITHREDMKVFYKLKLRSL